MEQLDIFLADEERNPRLTIPEAARAEVMQAMARLLLGLVLPHDNRDEEVVGDE